MARQSDESDGASASVPHIGDRDLRVFAEKACRLAEKWMRAVNGAEPQSSQDDDLSFPQLDLDAFKASAMENKGLNVFNIGSLVGKAEPEALTAEAPAEEPVYSVETAQPFRIMPPLRYRSRSFLSL